jgi:hypothetical protein
MKLLTDPYVSWLVALLLTAAVVALCRRMYRMRQEAQARVTGPGEWLTPDSEGFTAVEMKKGDILSVPRMTPHKRITEESVSLLQINGLTT